jgi:hypothetical protein
MISTKLKIIIIKSEGSPPKFDSIFMPSIPDKDIIIHAVNPISKDQINLSIIL